MFCSVNAKQDSKRENKSLARHNLSNVNRDLAVVTVEASWRGGRETREKQKESRIRKSRGSSLSTHSLSLSLVSKSNIFDILSPLSCFYMAVRHQALLRIKNKSRLVDKTSTKTHAWLYLESHRLNTHYT